MALWDLVAVLLRWRYVTLAGGALALVAAIFVMKLPGVYFMQANVVFLAPPAASDANAFQSTPASLVSVAGIVERRVNQPSSDALPVVSDSVTLVGEGATHGYSVRLPNSGGQWAYNFDRAVLDVQAAGTSATEVQNTFTAAVAQINAELVALQRAKGIPPGEMIKTQLSPPDPPIHFGKGSRSRAGVITLLLGAGLTVAGVLALDGLSLRWRTPRRRPATRVISFRDVAQARREVDPFV